jgi:Domain of unknown function DUF11
MGRRHIVGSTSPRARLAVAFAGLVLVLLALAAGAQAEAVGAFQKLASSPEPVTSVTVDPTTNIIYAQGNQDTTFYKYSPVTNAWTSLPPATINSGNNGGAAYLGGKIYTAYTSDDTTLGVYTIASNSWSTIPNPLGTGTGNITAVGSLLYLAEGNSFVSYNPATSTTKPLANPPNFTGTSDCDGEGFTRWGALAGLSGKIYATQGDGCNGFTVYDITSNTWHQLPNVPAGATLGGAINPVTKAFLAYGDYGGSNFYNYDIASNTWSTTTFAFNDIEDGGMAYVSGAGLLQGVYAVQGEDDPGFARYTVFQDATVATSAGSSKVTAGFPALLSSVVANGGPASGPVQFTDQVPAGLTILSATAGLGTCSVSGQTVSCTITRLVSGQGVTVNILVRPAKSGNYANGVSVAAGHGLVETNAANNTASATLRVAPRTQCVVPKLKFTPAKVAKRVLKLLSCKPGKVAHAHSNTVKKGLVIKTKPKAGTFAPGTVVKLQVSSGPKK